MLRILAILLLILSCSAPSKKPTTAKVAKTPPNKNGEFTAHLVQNADGTWTVAYSFDHKRPALLFDSGGDYRANHWESKSPGNKIENLHGLDVLLLDPPMAQAQFVIRPPETMVEGTQPFLLFSDGSEAIHLGQFPVLTIANRTAAENLKGSLRDWRGRQPTVQVTLASSKAILLPDGRRATGKVTLPIRGGGGYVYIGEIQPIDTEKLRAIVDPGLPIWLADRFKQDIQGVYDAHHRRWGEPAAKAFILLAFGGTEGADGEFNNKGYAAGAQLSMTIRGQVYAAENDDAVRNLLWFFAHEAAHQYQFRGGFKKEPGSDWITEGSANTMAVAVLHDLGMMNKSRMERRYWQTHRECVAELGDGPIQGKRGRSGYVCGDLIAQMTAASLPNHDFFGFWNEFREAANQQDRGKLTADRYFAVLRKRGAANAVVDSLQKLVGTRLDAPEKALAAAMQTSGLQPVFADDGGLSTMRFPAVANPE